MSLHRPLGSGGSDATLVDLEPEDAGWEWTGLRVVILAPGHPVSLRTAGSESFVLPLAGSLTVGHG